MSFRRGQVREHIYKCEPAVHHAYLLVGMVRANWVERFGQIKHRLSHGVELERFQ